jgi:hypothetical protein
MMIGKHGYDGNCSPLGHESSAGQETFSVGIFEWVETRNKIGVKRGPVKVRVKGRYSHPQAVYDKAQEIASDLDAGTYNGPKNVSVIK